MKEPISKQATIVSVTRRNVQVLYEHRIVPAMLQSALASEICVGDRVIVSEQATSILVNELLARNNLISRSYREEEKLVAANLDHIYIVTSILPICQPEWIDRLICIARSQEIALSLVVNKSDLGVDELKEIIDIYAELNFKVLVTSAKYGQGLHELRGSIEASGVNAVALAGVSGVGKSSIINALVPEATQRIGELSQKGSRGKQTTSQAVGYVYSSSKRQSPLLIIDLPGIQNFGVAHLSEDQIRAGFWEIFDYGRGCRFSNCSHILEVECAVQDAVRGGAIAISRYSSYCKMIEEVKQAREY